MRIKFMFRKLAYWVVISIIGLSPIILQWANVRKGGEHLPDESLVLFGHGELYICSAVLASTAAADVLFRLQEAADVVRTYHVIAACIAGATAFYGASQYSGLELMLRLRDDPAARAVVKLNITSYVRESMMVLVAALIVSLLCVALSSERGSRT